MSWRVSELVRTGRFGPMAAKHRKGAFPERELMRSGCWLLWKGAGEVLRVPGRTKACAGSLSKKTTQFCA